MKPTLLRVALVVLLLAVQLATVAIVVLGMKNQTGEQFESNARSQFAQLQRTTSDRLDALISPVQRTLASARSLITSGALDARSDAQVSRWLMAELATLPQASSVQFGRSDGSLVQVSRQQDNFLTRVVSGPNFEPVRSGEVAAAAATGSATVADQRRPGRSLGPFSRVGARSVTMTLFDPQFQAIRSWSDPAAQVDPRQSRWFEMAQVSPSITLSGVGDYLMDRAPGIVLGAVASFPDTTRAGVLGVDVPVERLQELLAGAGLPAPGSIALIDDSGRALAYRDATNEALSEAAVPEPAERALGEPLQALLASRQIDLINDGAAIEQWVQQSGFNEFDTQGERHYGLAAPLRLGNSATTWLLSAQAPATQFAGETTELFSRKLRTLLAVILIPALIAALAIFGLHEPAVRTPDEHTTDELTGFLRREEFRRRLDGMLLNRRELEYGGRIVAVALEMDGFNELVRRYGRETGDIVLRQFARRLRSRVRQHDLLGRSGIDEFIIALRVDRNVDVLTTVNRIRRATVVKPFVTPSGRHLLGVTAGIACVDPNESVDDLLARANQALITGKVRDKNRSYLAAARDATWPQTGMIVPPVSEADTEEHSPALQI